MATVLLELLESRSLSVLIFPIGKGAWMRRVIFLLVIVCQMGSAHLSNLSLAFVSELLFVASLFTVSCVIVCFVE